MASTGLEGPFDLTQDVLDSVVTATAPGAYALGAVKDGAFHVRRVGRSDDDLSKILRKYVGAYDKFEAKYMSSARAAFEKECRLYHDFGPPDNAVHPERPAGTDWQCPRCTKVA